MVNTQTLDLTPDAPRSYNLTLPIQLLINDIIRVTLNTELDSLWLRRLCAKITSLNLVKPFALHMKFY